MQHCKFKKKRQIEKKKRKEPETAGGLVSGVLDGVLPSVFDDFVVDMQRRLVRDIQDPSHFARVRQIHSPDACHILKIIYSTNNKNWNMRMLEFTGSGSHVHFFDGEEREGFGAEVGFGQFGEDGPRQRPHHAPEFIN